MTVIIYAYGNGSASARGSRRGVASRELHASGGAAARLPHGLPARGTPIDRVLSFNFVYEFKGYELIPQLSGKKALIFTSSGADMSYLEESGQWRAMQVLEKDHILALCGIELLDHVHFPSITPDLPEQIGRRQDPAHLAVGHHRHVAGAGGQHVDGGLDGQLRGGRRGNAGAGPRR